MLVEYSAKGKSGRGEECSYIHSGTGHYLYNSKDVRIAETTSVQEWEA